MSPNSKSDRLKSLGRKIKGAKPEPVKTDPHFKIGSTTTAVWGIVANGKLVYAEPVNNSRPGQKRETEEEKMIRLRNLAIALEGNLGILKLLATYTPLEFTPVESYED